MNHVSASLHLMKMYVIQCKNEIMLNVSVIVKNKMIGVHVERFLCEILVRVIARAIKYVI